MLLILEELARVGVPVTPTDVNEVIGLPKPTIHRLFSTLEAEGYIQREVDGRSYSPGRRMRQLSVHVLTSLRVRTARLAVLNRLADEVGETCNLAMPERDGMVYLDRVETKWPLRIQLPIGTQVPFYCTASGKLYLSTLTPRHLERYLRSARLEAHTEKTLVDRENLRTEIEIIRQRGYSQDNEEFMDNMVAVAVPIHDDQDRLLAALAIHGPTQRLSLDLALDHLPLMKDAAAELASLAVS